MKRLDELELQGKRVLVRVDFNVPLNEKGEVTWNAGQLDQSDIYLLRRFSLGDLNCDGGLDALDIEPFILALFDPQTYPGRHPECDPLLADINQDEAVDALDHDDPGLRAMVLTLMATAEQGAGDPERARGRALDAAELARRAGDSVRLTEAGIA